LDSGSDRVEDGDADVARLTKGLAVPAVQAGGSARCLACVEGLSAPSSSHHRAVFKERDKGNLVGVRESDERADGGVGFAALDYAEVLCMNARPLGGFLLGELLLFADGP